MNETEAQKLAAIIDTADGGCSHCVSQLVNKLRAEFPEWDWAAMTSNYDPEQDF